MIPAARCDGCLCDDHWTAYSLHSLRDYIALDSSLLTNKYRRNPGSGKCKRCSAVERSWRHLLAMGNAYVDKQRLLTPFGISKRCLSTQAFHIVNIFLVARFVKLYSSQLYFKKVVS